MDDKLIELNNMRETAKEMQQMYISDCVSVGDFTYGVPRVLSWDDKTKLVIGKFCSIAENVIIVLGGEHRSDWISTYPFNALLPSFSYIQGHPHSKGDVYIGNDVWIASGVKILSGVSIGDGAIIGANSIVTKNVEPYSVVCGNPIKFVKYRFDEQTRISLCNVKWWDKADEQIVEIVPLLQSGDFDELWRRLK